MIAIPRRQMMDLVQMGHKDAESAWLRGTDPTSMASHIEHTSECLVQAIEKLDAPEIVRLKSVLQWHLDHLSLVGVEEEMKK